MEEQRPTTHADCARRALIVDDEITTLQLMKHMLEHLGYNVTACHDENDAAHIYKKAQHDGHCFNIVFLDLNMSRKTSGIHILQELKQIDHSVFAVCFTGDTQNIDLKSHGFAHVLHKPIGLSRLRTALQSFSTEA